MHFNQISGNPTPISSEELTDCWHLVQDYLADKDENSILAVVPDMRLIQTCFRCLKMTCNLTNGVVGSKEALQMIKLSLPDSVRFTQTQKVRELFHNVSQRENEISKIYKMKS
jgi:asparagine synthetase A